MASLTCLELAQLASEAGVPPGVLSVITGLGPDAGAPLRYMGTNMRRCAVFRVWVAVVIIAGHVSALPVGQEVDLS